MRLNVKSFLMLACSLSGPSAVRAQVPSEPGVVIRAETRLVLVDTVVTDKKGRYVRDLERKDFRVWEDGKEQSITSFSYASDAACPWHAERQYVALFFDNSSLTTGDQMNMRAAAVNWLEANAGNGTVFAVFDYGIGLRVTQNFTSNLELLKKAVMTAQSGPTWTGGIAGRGQSRAIAGPPGVPTRHLQLMLRGVARALANIPGRKILILVSAGVVSDASEFDATIRAFNRANVAVYPLDPSGPTGPSSSLPPFGSLRRASPARSVFANGFLQQKSGGQTGGSGGQGSGSAGKPGGSGNSGGSGGSGGTGGSGSSAGGATSGGNSPISSSGGTMGRPLNTPSDMYGPGRMLQADLKSQLTALAKQTGGFVTESTNDILGGLTKVSSERNEFYLLGYAAPESAGGSCHEIRVKVARSGTNVRARSSYCNGTFQDQLKGTETGTELERRAAADAGGKLTGSLRLPFFYTGANTARVNVSMEIPRSALDFQKQKGKLRAVVNILGAAYGADGKVAARFSDTVTVEAEDKAQIEASSSKSLRYDNQFEISPGEYKFKLVFATGRDSFGKIEAPLNIEPFDGKQFALSGLALSSEMRRADAGSAGDGGLLEGRTPLIVSGIEMIPSATHHFKRTDKPTAYTEIFDPAITGSNPPGLGFQVRIVDRASGAQRFDSGWVEWKPGTPRTTIVPLGLNVRVDTLTPGAYRVEVQAANTAGSKSKVRAADFEVE